MSSFNSKALHPTIRVTKVKQIAEQDVGDMSGCYKREYEET